MTLLDFIKIKCIEEGTNLTALTKEYNDTYGANVGQQSMYRRIKEETIKHTEVQQLAALLGYDIQWIKREKV
jgi:hypothetical protein